MVNETLAQELSGVTKLNLGCGGDFVKGWLNVALFSNDEFTLGKVKKDDRGDILNFDLTQTLPLKESSLEYIHSSHFIEHITFDEGRKLLTHCYKWLKLRGVIRLSFPDLELWVSNYHNNKIEFFEQYKKCFLGGNSSLQVTKGEIFMSQVHGHGHRWNYDFESINHVLSEIGFSQIEKKKHWDSQISEIREIEPGDPSRTMETCYVEAIK